MMSLDLAEVSQCVLPGNNRNEIELQFPESDAVEANKDQLVSIRFYIPPDPDQDTGDKSLKTRAELLQQKIMSTASIRKASGDVIVEFEHEKGSFLTPRGRYSIELCTFFFNPTSILGERGCGGGGWFMILYPNFASWISLTLLSFGIFFTALRWSLLSYAWTKI